MVKRKTKDEKLQEQLDMLAKYKSKGVHDRLLGSTSNHNDMDTSIIIDDNKSKDTNIFNDTSINTSKDNDISIDNITSDVNDGDNDISKSITIDKDTSNVTDIINDEVISTGIDDGKSNSNDIDKGNNESTITNHDTSNITSGLPKVETEEKKYVSLYLRESVSQRFDKFVRDQVKKQKLKNAKIKSFYGEIAIEEFLKKYGY